MECNTNTSYVLTAKEQRKQQETGHDSHVRALSHPNRPRQSGVKFHIRGSKFSLILILPKQ